MTLAFGLGAATALALAERRRSADAKDAQRGPERAPTSSGLGGMQLDQLDHATRMLQDAQTGRADLQHAVHETRKAIKRVRTLERLRTEETARARRAHHKAIVRGAAEALGGARDSEVALATLERLIERDPKRFGASPGVARLRAALAAERRAAENALRGSGGLQHALRLLRAARAQLAEEMREPGLGKRKARGARRRRLARLYARGEMAMRRARSDGNIAQMHEWRKRVKDLRYAAEALDADTTGGGGKKTRLHRIARRADRLGETLGEEHDLALLAQRVEIEDELFGDDRRGRKRLLRAIKRARLALRQDALRRGRTLYSRKPKRFARWALSAKR